MIKQDILENQVRYSYIAIGSNLGNRIENIEKAKLELHSKIKIIKTSSNFESPSWPNEKNPKFINIIIKIQTHLNELDLLEVCNLIEKKLGRKRSFKNAPRSCDIDIIDYKQKILNGVGEKLILPHPRMSERNFVLLPLFELDKSWKHPITKLSIVNLLNSLSINDLRSIKQI